MGRNERGIRATRPSGRRRRSYATMRACARRAEARIPRGGEARFIAAGCASCKVHRMPTIPALDWLRSYERAILRGDVGAGLAFTALVVPKNLAYAEIAGVPVQNGLYAAAAGAIIYALFATSRQISTGPSSSLAAVAGGAVVATSVAGDQA